MRDKLPTNGAYEERPLDLIRWLVAHHSAVARDSTAEAVANYHIGNLGWPGIGYHFIVHQDGVIEQVNNLETKSYNVASRNHECVGVLLPGNWMTTPPTSPQLKACRWLMQHLLTILPGRKIVGHYEVAVPGWETSCPGPLWPEWKSQITN